MDVHILFLHIQYCLIYKYTPDVRYNTRNHSQIKLKNNKHGGRPWVATFTSRIAHSLRCSHPLRKTCAGPRVWMDRGGPGYHPRRPSGRSQGEPQDGRSSRSKQMKNRTRFANLISLFRKTGRESASLGDILGDPPREFPRGSPSPRGIP